MCSRVCECVSVSACVCVRALVCVRPCVSLAQTLSLSRAHQTTRISGVSGLSHNPPLQSIANLKIASTRAPGKKMELTAVVVPRVTCDLPLHPVTFDPTLNQLTDIPLADPEFGLPGRVDILLGVGVHRDITTWQRGDPTAS